MIVPDATRKCVVFVGYKMANDEMRFAGSAFFLGRSVDDTFGTGVRLITAKHVIDGIRKLGIADTYIRINTTYNQSGWSKCEGEWQHHPTDPSVDVAVLYCGIPADWDYLVIPLSLCATTTTLAENEVGLGDEVFITGLFRHHHGRRRNIPIVRIGNLAAMTEEKVQTKEFGLIDAYLIETRSIGGLSGSPVFLNLGVTRQIKNQIVQSSTGPYMRLLGLVHGHYDVPVGSLDTDTQGQDQAASSTGINTGISIVVPIEKIIEVFDIYSPAPT